MPIEYSGPNAEQIRYWNESGGPKWVALQSIINAQVEPLGLLAMDRARIRAGESVLDVGCGCAATTLEIARRVGEAGGAVGIDISEPMLERARQSAHEAEAKNIRFDLADAQLHVFPPDSFDLAFSRFGVMFFADPETAFRNLRGALRPGARLAFICWRRPDENPWVMVPLLAALPHIAPPTPPPPGAPGPFSFADPGRVKTVLEGAGFGDVELEAVDREMAIGGGGDLEQAVHLALQIGPLAMALREQGAHLREPVANAVREALARFAREDGVWLGAGAWIVTARRAG